MTPTFKFSAMSSGPKGFEALVSKTTWYQITTYDNKLCSSCSSTFASFCRSNWIFTYSSTSTQVLKQCKKSLCRVSPGRNEDSTVGRFLMFYFLNQHSMTQLVLSLTGKVSKMYLIVSAKFKTSLSARAQDGMKGEFWRLGKSIGMGKG